MTATDREPLSTVRLAVDELVPHVSDAMEALDAASRKTQLEPSLLELIRTRADRHVSDDLWNRVASHFTESELAELLWIIAVINAWNRLGAAARPWPIS